MYLKWCIIFIHFYTGVRKRITNVVVIVVDVEVAGLDCDV